MPKMYRSIAELYSEVLSTLVIELVPHAFAIDPGLLETLIDPPSGLYMPGCVEPLFRNGTTYKTVDAKFVEIGHSLMFDDIFSDFLNEKRLPPGHLYDEANNITIKRRVYERIKGRLESEPTLPIKGCELAIGAAIEYLNSLCAHAGLPLRKYQLTYLVKPEFHHLIDTQQFSNCFDELHKEIDRFVGKDEWNHYYYKIKGTTLIIEKGLDYRIVEWHKQQIEKSDAFDHDIGGIYEEYELDGSPKINFSS